MDCKGQVQAALPPGKKWYALCRRLGGPQGRFGRVQKISSPPSFDPQTDQPVASRYIDHAFLPHIITIIIIIILVITFMQGIYNYTPETKHVSRVYSVAGVLYLQSVLHVMLFRP